MIRWIEWDIHHINTPEIKGDDFFDQMQKLCLLNFPTKKHKEIIGIINWLRKKEKQDSIITWSKSEQLKFIQKALDKKSLDWLKRSIDRELLKLREENNWLKPFPKEPKTTAEKKVPIQTTPWWEIKNRKQKTLTLKTRWERITLIKDSWLYFYRVVAWDSISLIENKLQKYFKWEFSHLNEQQIRNKLKWFNISSKKLKPGLLIPVPWDQEDRLMTDRQFTNACHEWINMIAKNDYYWKYAQTINDIMLEQDLVWLMIAVAKQESWGAPLWQFEFHRREPHKKAFSFSIFHILMSWPGLRARQKLWHTEWQMYNPIIASKVFIAFIIEKITQWKDMPLTEFKKRAQKILVEIEGKTSPSDFEKFAYFYNWANWKKINPHYAKNMSRYFNSSQKLLELAQI